MPIGNPKDESLVLKPAIEGTLSILKSAVKHKVKRVVITSSTASVFIKENANKKEIYSDDDWSDVNACDTYQKSKLLAEQEAWNFHKSLPESQRFELVALNPCIILGPYYGTEEFASM